MSRSIDRSERMTVATTHHKFIWGWLRLFLGFVQMTLASFSIGALLVLGLHPLTIALVIGTTAVTFISRRLYRDQSGDRRQKGESNE